MKAHRHTIRAAGFEDAAAIFALVKQNPAELVPRPLSDIVQNIDRFFVAVEGPELVGMVSWQILPEIGAARHPTVEVKSLAVRKDRQRTGVGRHLVTTAIDRVRTLHPSQIIVLTFHPEFFRKLGFGEVAKETLMHKIYIGCINCSKYDSPFTCPEVAMALPMDGKQAKPRQP